MHLSGRKTTHTKISPIPNILVEADMLGRFLMLRLEFLCEGFVEGLSWETHVKSEGTAQHGETN